VIPETRKSDLEKIEAELKKEVEAWNELGMSLDGTVHVPASIYFLKMQVQTIINFMLEKEIAANEEFNLEFKTLILNDMRRMREENEPNIKEARRQAIVGGAKPQIAVPKIRVLGKDGRELDI